MDLPAGIILEITVFVKPGWRPRLSDPNRLRLRRFVVAHRARFKNARINLIGRDDNTIPTLLRWEQSLAMRGANSVQAGRSRRRFHHFDGLVGLPCSGQRQVSSSRLVDNFHRRPVTSGADEDPARSWNALSTVTPAAFAGSYSMVNSPHPSGKLPVVSSFTVGQTGRPTPPQGLVLSSRYGDHAARAGRSACHQAC